MEKKRKSSDPGSFSLVSPVSLRGNTHLIDTESKQRSLSHKQRRNKSQLQRSAINVGSADRSALKSCQSLPFPQGLTSEVCAVVTPISIDLSAFPLLFENDIMFPGASCGRQCEPAFLRYCRRSSGKQEWHSLSREAVRSAQAVNWRNLVSDGHRLLWAWCWVGTNSTPPFSKVKTIGLAPVKRNGLWFNVSFLVFLGFFFPNNSTSFAARAKDLIWMVMFEIYTNAHFCAV